MRLCFDQCLQCGREVDSREIVMGCCKECMDRYINQVCTDRERMKAEMDKLAEAKAALWSFGKLGKEGR